MTLVAVLTHRPSLNSLKPTPKSSNLQPSKHPPSSCCLIDPSSSHRVLTSRFFRAPAFSRIRSFRREDGGSGEPEKPRDTPDEQDRFAVEILGNQNFENAGSGTSFLAKLVMALGVAATITLIYIGLRPASLGSSIRVQSLAEGSSSSSAMACPAGFSFKAFGYKCVLPEYAPGWIYFWLLMAAGCGLFISEEALNIWVCPYTGWHIFSKTAVFGWDMAVFC